MRPIGVEDLDEVAAFLQRNHEPSVSLERWRGALGQPWGAESPNRGFMLRAGGKIVGAYVAYYSEQAVDGRVESFCNLGSWYVLPGHRFHSLRLLRALLAQDGYSFTDVTPVNEVAAVDLKLGFEALDTASSISPGLPLPIPARGVTIHTDPAAIGGLLDGAERDLYRDHAEAPGAIHAAIESDRGNCYVVARRDHWKRLPVLRVLHVGDPELFRRFARPLTRRLLARHRAVAQIVEDRLVPGYRPRPSLRLRSPQPRLFRGERLRPEDVGYLYTELACISW